MGHVIAPLDALDQPCADWMPPASCLWITPEAWSLAAPPANAQSCSYLCFSDGITLEDKVRFIHYTILQRPERNPNSSHILSILGVEGGEPDLLPYGLTLIHPKSDDCDIDIGNGKWRAILLQIQRSR